MLDPGRHRLEAGELGTARHLVRNSGRGEIDLRDRQAHQRVAHGAADDARLFSVAIQRVEHFRDVTVAEQRLEGGARPCADAVRRHGFAAGASKPPGTRRPFSICAGR